jgi:lipoprotein-anchoring transpeptidase ErfK/SrfK
MNRFVGAAIAAAMAVAGSLAAIAQAGADIVVAINKSTQRMTVMVDGQERHVWKVSTGLGGGPPSGSYRPERMERKWFSHKYNWSPMPHAIFFHEGYAIHGTGYVSRLGQRASHGCVRLLPANAATLFELVRSKGTGSTRIVVSSTDYAAKPVTRHSTKSARKPAAEPASRTEAVARPPATPEE